MSATLVITGGESGYGYLVTEETDDVIKLFESAKDEGIDFVRLTSSQYKNLPVYIAWDGVYAVHAVEPYRTVAVKEDEYQQTLARGPHATLKLD